MPPLHPPRSPSTHAWRTRRLTTPRPPLRCTHSHSTQAAPHAAHTGAHDHAARHTPAGCRATHATALPHTHKPTQAHTHTQANTRPRSTRTPPRPLHRTLPPHGEIPPHGVSDPTKISNHKVPKAPSCLSVPRLGGLHPAGGRAHVSRPCDRARPYWGRTRHGRRPPTPSQCVGVGAGRIQRPISLRVGAAARPGYQRPEKHEAHL